MGSSGQAVAVENGLSLPHFPSLPVFPLGYLSYHACANIVAKYEAHILKTQEWKLEHEKLLKEFFAWLEDGWDISYVKPEYEKKKKEPLK